MNPVDPRRLAAVPRLFSEEIAFAGANRDKGHLRLLAEEVGGLDWEVGGLRRVGVEQFMLEDWDAAKDSLEKVTELFPDDIEANALLGTVHQRRDDLAKPSLLRILIFTGHRIDAPGREIPRFPQNKADLARQWIHDAVAAEKGAAGDAPLLGISGGACGGDILFHEVCAELGVDTQMYLAIPAEDYIAASVAEGGAAWVHRFNDLQATTDPQVLAASRDLPKWLRTKKNYGVWQRSNLWLLHTAFALGGRVSLIALWNHQSGDGAGGTEDLVGRMNERGARVIVLQASKLLE